MSIRGGDDDLAASYLGLRNEHAPGPSQRSQGSIEHTISSAFRYSTDRAIPELLGGTAEVKEDVQLNVQGQPPSSRWKRRGWESKEEDRTKKKNEGCYSISSSLHLFISSSYPILHNHTLSVIQMKMTKALKKMTHSCTRKNSRAHSTLFVSVPTSPSSSSWATSSTQTFPSSSPPWLSMSPILGEGMVPLAEPSPLSLQLNSWLLLSSESWQTNTARRRLCCWDLFSWFVVTRSMASLTPCKTRLVSHHFTTSSCCCCCVCCCCDCCLLLLLLL